MMNAIDAIGARGSITLRTRNLPSGVELVVQDDGPGMTKEILDKALDPFFTTKPVGKGTGLGLAIVYGTMKAHRGQLDLSSQPGQGVRACLRFPASEESRTQPPKAPSVTSFPASASHTILLVDDDPLIQGAVSGMLRKLGHQVSSAMTGAEALVALESPATFSLVILDLNMPVLDGAATLPRLRALRPTLPVILATGRADQAAQDLARVYPLVTFLPKPFSFEELRQRIELATR
jgi:CheY-like chemotaxis protein